MIQYGSMVQQTLDANGAGVVVETKFRGSKVATITTYSESVLVENDQQLLAEILRHLEFCKAPGRLDPSFQMDTDRRTGQIKRLVRSWCEIA